MIIVKFKNFEKICLKFLKSIFKFRRFQILKIIFYNANFLNKKYNLFKFGSLNPF